MGNDFDRDRARSTTCDAEVRYALFFRDQSINKSLRWFWKILIWVMHRAFSQKINNEFCFLKTKNNQIPLFFVTFPLQTQFFHLPSKRSEHMETDTFDPWNIYKIGSEKRHVARACRGLCGPKVVSSARKQSVEAWANFFSFFLRMAHFSATKAFD